MHLWGPDHYLENTWKEFLQSLYTDFWRLEKLRVYPTDPHQLSAAGWSRIFRVFASKYHYSDVIMSTMASQITSVSIVYSTVGPGADQRKHQSSASLAFCGGNSPVAGEFPPQKASNAENAYIWWRHHDATVLFFMSHTWPHWCSLPTEKLYGCTSLIPIQASDSTNP